jgi:hypothetical protein
MKSIVVRDVRLTGWKPQGDFVLEVNFDTPITWFFTWVKDTAAKNGPDVKLQIMCHGYPGGLQFCKEGINASNVQLMSQLSGKLQGIELYACSVAYITPGSGGGAGDGNVFCYKMAKIAQTTVKASTTNQVYYTGELRGNALDFDTWEGTVLTYGPQGNVISVD